jgi:hypothetical protein
MKWCRCTQQTEPENQPVPPHREKIPHTRIPNIKPSALCMELIDLFSSWSDKCLHAVVAGSENARTQHVDDEVECNIPSITQSAITPIEHCRGHKSISFILTG